MVAIHCSLCVVVFPNISALHSHIRKHVPDGSYTYDFKSKTGYPNENPFPFISLSIVKEEQLNDKQTLTQKSKCIKVKDKNKKGIQKKTGKGKEPDSPIINIKEESDITDYEVSNSGVIDESQNELNSKADDSRSLASDGIHCYHETDDIQDDYDDNDDDGGNDIDNKISNDGTSLLISSSNHTDNAEIFADDADMGIGKEKDENYWESEVESDVKPRQTRSCRKRAKDKQFPDDEFEFGELDFEFIQEDGKTFFGCDVCGIQRPENKLVNHIVYAHKDEKLSDRLSKKMKELQSASKKQNKHQPKGKKVMKREKDPDFDLAEAEADEKANKIARRPIAPVTDDPAIIHSVSKKLYIECKLCGLYVQNAFHERHLKMHKTKRGKKMFRAENLANCPTCKRRVLKKYIDNHRCLEENPKLTKEEKKMITRKKKLSRRKEQLPCHVCGRLMRRWTMKAHLMVHSEVRPFDCQICKKSFITEARLEVHTASVHGDRIFQCEKCPRMFGHKSRLTEHMRTHREDRPYICQICGKGFRLNQTLRKHLFVHKGPDGPQFVCNHCGNRFSTNSTLQTHILAVHENLRKWICSWPGCAKLFKNSNHLRRHMLLHAGEKPMKCDRCDACFTQSSELKYHLKKKHDTDKMPPTPPDSNPFSGLPHAIISDPFSKDGVEPTKLKTIFFPTLKDQPFREHVLEIKESILTYKMGPPNHVKSDPQDKDTENKSLPDKTSAHLEDDEESLKLSSKQINNGVDSEENSLQHLVEQDQTGVSGPSKDVSENGQAQLKHQIDSGYVPTQLEHMQNQSDATLKASFSTSRTTTTVTSEGMFIKSMVNESSNSKPGFEMEDVARLATSSALEAIHFDEPMESTQSSHVTSSSSSDFQQLLSTSESLVQSLMNVDQEIDTSQGQSWEPFQ